MTSRKIGLTSEGIQRQLGVDSPDFGVLLDSHTFRSGDSVSLTAAFDAVPGHDVADFGALLGTVAIDIQK